MPVVVVGVWLIMSSRSDPSGWGAAGGLSCGHSAGPSARPGALGCAAGGLVCPLPVVHVEVPCLCLLLVCPEGTFSHPHVGQPLLAPGSCGTSATGCRGWSSGLSREPVTTAVWVHAGVWPSISGAICPVSQGALTAVCVWRSLGVCPSWCPAPAAPVGLQMASYLISDNPGFVFNELYFLE